jgi:hypothetical protein
MTIDEIALKVAQRLGTRRNYAADMIAYARALLAELANQEPVGVITWLEGICCFEPTEGNDYPAEFT